MLADEADDCSNWEQLPLVLRYVQERKELVEFVRCERTTGKALSKLLLVWKIALRTFLSHFRAGVSHVHAYACLRKAYRLTSHRQCA